MTDAVKNDLLTLETILHGGVRNYPDTLHAVLSRLLPNLKTLLQDDVASQLPACGVCGYWLASGKCTLMLSSPCSAREKDAAPCNYFERQKNVL